MAPRRFKKSDTNQENCEKYKNLVIGDVLCPICRSILIEPVTLPCNHGFCLSCFNGTMENTSLTCPLCRLRVGSWLRNARKTNKIINVTLWGIIQHQFSKEIRKKVEGEDVMQEDKINVKLADPGEIRREYELELQKEKSVIDKERENENIASELVIKKILENEQKAAKIREESLRLDEELARKYLKEQQKPIASTSTSSSTTKTKVAKKSSIEKYLISLSKKKPEIVISQCKPVETVVSSNYNQTSKDTTTSLKNTTTVSNYKIINKDAPQKSGIKTYTSTIMCQDDANNYSTIYNKKLLFSKYIFVERSNSNGSDSGDSIKQEMTYFKPIYSAPKSRPKLQQDGQIVRVPILKIPPAPPKRKRDHSIRGPQPTMGVRIIPHSLSAFANCIREKNIIQPPSIVTDSGKVIKQYYNKHRNSLYKSSKPATITSSYDTDFLGFERELEHRNVQIMKNIIKKLTDSINECVNTEETVKQLLNVNKLVRKQSIDEIVIPIKPITTNVKPVVGDTTKNTIVKSVPAATAVVAAKNSFKHTNLINSNNKTSEIKTNALVVVNKQNNFIKTTSNGYNNQKDSGLDVTLQEELDLEYAKRLHEELNNPRLPRQTRASVQTKPLTKTRSSPRKRQITLDEFMPPKKFKI